jgi:hypothetical protein
VHWFKGISSNVDRKKYKCNRPGICETFYDSWEVEVIDPFGNRLSFNEKKI